MKRFNGKNGIPEMEENPQGHWISWHEHNLAMLEMSKSIERNWEASCSSGDKIKHEYEDKLSKQQNVIVYQSVVIFAFSAIFIFVIGLL